MSGSGIYGPTRCIAGIVAFVDLRLGDCAKRVMERHIAVSDGRVRGIWNGSTWSDNPILNTFTAGGLKGLLLDKLSQRVRCSYLGRPDVRYLDVSDAVTRSDRPRARFPANNDRAQPRWRAARHQPLRRQARRGIHGLA
jgi:hypothetical protein